MDFFEKAHVTRKQPPTNTKSEENMKRQLKQMLYGYKKSDNELIMRGSALDYKDNEVNQGFDDSVSVSGFSDLNLTVSDHEADNSQDLTAEILDDSVSLKSEENLSNSSVNDHLDSLSEGSLQSSGEPLHESQAGTQESSTEYNEDVDLLLEDVHNSEESSVSSDDLSFSTEMGSNDSEYEFDPDGSLANKILEKLAHKDVVNKKGKKRKLDDKPKKSDVESSAKETSDGEKTSEFLSNMRKLSIEKDDIEVSEECIDSSTQDSVSTNQSTPFISISASNMPDQPLSEILGDYRHPTIRNLPSEKHNVIYSTNNSGLFSAESLDMQIGDVDSLTPELGDDQFIEDLDIDADSNTVMPVEESTDVYDTLQSESVVDLSTDEEFVDSVKVYYGNNNACIFVLKHPAKLYINGKVMITPLGGTVEVFGHVLKDKVNLYALNHSYAQCLKTIEKDNAYYGLFGRLTAQGLTVAEAEEIVTTIGESDGILSIKPLHEVKMEFVENNFPISDLFSRPNKSISKIDRNLTKASSKLNCSIYLSRPWRYFEENDCWDIAIEYGLCVTSKGIICGGKGLGKSTFLRYYVNRLLAKGPVLVIDLDPGQAEFTVAGNISATIVDKPLLGPNFTHLKKPEIMLNIGMINVMDSVVRYATAVADLLAQCRASYNHLPWIINTMGMCNHTGLRLITYIILHAKPTFLMQIDSKVLKKRFQFDLKPTKVTELYFEDYKRDKLFWNVPRPDRLHYTFVSCQHVEGSERHNSSLSPRDERYLNFLAYFGELLQHHNAVGLLGIVPYEVKLSDINFLTNVKVAPESLKKVLNGKVVALCRPDGAEKGKLLTLEDKPLRCHGHGLIRSVDFKKGILFVITPTPADELATVNALVYADWVPELGGQESSLPAGTPLPYHTSHPQQHKQLMLSPRRRFNPLQLLKISRNT